MNKMCKRNIGELMRNMKNKIKQKEIQGENREQDKGKRKHIGSGRRNIN